MIGLQKLLDAALPGSTVVIPPGLHREAAIVRKPVTIEAAGAHLHGVVARGKAALVVAAPNVVINGLEISGIAVGYEYFTPASDDLSQGGPRMLDLGTGRGDEDRVSTDRKPARWTLNRKRAGLRPFDPDAAGWWQLIIDGEVVGQFTSSTTTGTSNLDSLQLCATISAVPVTIYARNLFAVAVEGPR